MKLKPSPPYDVMDDSTHARFCWLSWRILEYKIYYYEPQLIDPKFADQFQVDDHYYDAVEIEYMGLCKKFRCPNTLVHHSFPNLRMEDEMLAGEDINDFVPGLGMFEVNEDRPCVHLVLSKYGTAELREKYKDHRSGN